MTIRPATEADWPGLKTVRLAALLDAPTAFGASHREASACTDEQWKARAAGPHPATNASSWTSRRVKITKW